MVPMTPPISVIPAHRRRFPRGTAVLYIFFRIHPSTRITQQNGQLKVDAAAGTDLHQQIVSLAGGLADQEDLPFSMVSTGLMFSSPPASAVVLEMRPPA